MDIAARLRRALPRGWFPDDAPVLEAVLAGFGGMWAAIYDQVAYVRLQTRIATATGANLDLIAADFFGGGLQRRTGESDEVLRYRIKRELFREKATRAAVVSVLTDLTGVAPVVFEPRRTTDTGGWTVGGMGYGVAGGLGSLALPMQAFITAFRAAPSGIGNVAGFYLGSGGDFGGWGQGAIMWGSLSQVAGLVTDADIYAAVAGVMPEATIAWTAISSEPVKPLPPGQPVGLTAAPPSNGSAGKLVLSWSPPSDGGAVGSYMVFSRLSGSGAFSIAATGVTGTTTTLSGLTPSVAYDVAVAGVNGAGPGTLAIASATPLPNAITLNSPPPSSFAAGTGPGFNVAISPNTNDVNTRAAWGSSATVEPVSGWQFGSNFSGNLWAWYLDGGAAAAPGPVYLWVESRDAANTLTGLLVSGPYTVT